MSEGSVNEAIINICFFISEILENNLEDVDFLHDKHDIQFILEQFFVLFKLIVQKFEYIDNKSGYVNMPAHRIF